jgi:tRNA(fMet)-specific endonuclease VapC
MRFLLDTDVFSVLAQQRHAPLAARIEALGFEAFGLSVISAGEIRFGLASGPQRPALTARIDILMSRISCLPLEPAVVAPYAQLRSTLRRAGTPIGPNDCWIAAHAMAHDLTLITGNQREFSRVPGLKVENWLR